MNSSSFAIYRHHYKHNPTIFSEVKDFVSTICIHINNEIKFCHAKFILIYTETHADFDHASTKADDKYYTSK